MAVSDTTITLATFLKLQAPSGDVRLTMGGFLDYDGERYKSDHNIFGTVLSTGDFNNGFGDLAEGGALALAPNPDAALSDWYRADLVNAQVEIWWGEVNGKTVSNAKRLGDLLVDTVGIGLSEGSQTLSLGLISRPEKLFITNEGNVCSTRHHQRQYATERGFDNCTGVPGYLAWGVQAAPRASGGGGDGRKFSPGRANDERAF